MFHGSYNVPLLKLHIFFTPHAQANFMGRNLPSLIYKDPALEITPVFWINPTSEIYQPVSHWWYPLYTVEQFSRTIPTLRDWHDWLELNFRARWRLGTRTQQHSVPTCMEQSGMLFEEFHNQWYSCILMMTSPMGTFNSIPTDPSDPIFWINLRISRLWTGTLPQMTQGKMRLVLALDGLDHAKRQMTTNLCPQFPTPYWVSKPYSGIGFLVQLQDRDDLPLYHLETTSSIMFHEHAPALIFTLYFVLKGQSMLTILSCHYDSYDFKNYHLSVNPGKFYSGYSGYRVYRKIIV